MENSNTVTWTWKPNTRALALYYSYIIYYVLRLLYLYISFFGSTKKMEMR